MCFQGNLVKSAFWIIVLGSVWFKMNKTSLYSSDKDYMASIVSFNRQHLGQPKSANSSNICVKWNKDLDLVRKKISFYKILIKKSTLRSCTYPKWVVLYVSVDILAFLLRKWKYFFQKNTSHFHWLNVIIQKAQLFQSSSAN